MVGLSSTEVPRGAFSCCGVQLVQFGPVLHQTLAGQEVCQPGDHQGLSLGHGAQEPRGDGWGTKVHLQEGEERLRVGVPVSKHLAGSPLSPLPSRGEAWTRRTRTARPRRTSSPARDKVSK